MVVRIPNFAFPELEYTGRILFETILGLTVKFEQHTSEEIDVLIADSVLQFPSLFFLKAHTGFSTSTVDDEIFNTDVIAGNVSMRITPIFGLPTLTRYEDVLRSEFDLFGSAFYILSRWEENQPGLKDEHGRYDATSSILVKYNLIKRPLIEEYAHYLYEILKSLGLKEERKQTTPKIEISHDIDYIVRWKDLRSLAGAWKQNLASFRIKDFVESTRSWFSSQRNRTNDSYFNFHYLKSEAEKRSLVSTFYFKTDGKGGTDPKTDYDIDENPIRKILFELLQRGASIGLHSGYHSFDNIEIIEKEKRKLESALGISVQKVRADYLRIAFPKSLKVYDELGFTEDSSASFTHFPGFRNGMCRPFPVFDLVERKILEIEELPLMAMMSSGRKASVHEVTDEMISLISIVKNCGGHVSILWHNSDADTEEKRLCFERMLDAASIH